MFVLSSLQRLRRYLDVDDNVKNNRYLTNFLYSASREIQAFVNRELESKLRTEYFDVDAPGRIEFFTKAVPVTSITSIDHDTTGLFSGSESSLTDFYPGTDGRSVVLDHPVSVGPKAIKVVYTGGEATHGTQSAWAVVSTSGFAAGKFVFGQTSGAWGIIVSASGTTMVIDVLSGAFIEGETIAESDTEGGASTGDTTTLSSIDAQSLAEKIPEYAMAAEMQIRQTFTRRDTFEMTEINKEGAKYWTTPSGIGRHWGLTREVRSMVQQFRRYL